MGVVGAIAGLFGAKKLMKAPDTPTVETPAAAAAPAADVTKAPETGADTASAVLRKKAKGKNSLTVPISSSSSGGTGLNI